MAPPSPLVALLYAAAWLALFVYLANRPIQARSAWERVGGLLLGGGVIATIVIGGHVVLAMPGVPYNVKELTDRYATIALIALGVVLLASGGLPMTFASLWRRKPNLFAAVFIPLVAAIGSVVFFIIWPVVPLDSMDDIVGSPVLGIGGVLERWLRFVALFAGPLAGMTLGARLAFPLGRAASMAAGLAATLAALMISYLVVVRFAGTDNIVELIRGNGNAWASMGVGGYFVLLGALIGMVSRCVSGRIRGRAVAALASLLLLLLAVPLSWQILVLATNPRIEKYDKVFSARQFLLSTDRGHYLDDRELFPRFAVLQLGMSVIFATGAVSALLVTGDDSGETLRRPNRGRASASRQS